MAYDGGVLELSTNGVSWVDTTFVSGGYNRTLEGCVSQNPLGPVLTLPQAVIPFFGGPLIDALNGPHGNGGYRIVFSSAVVFLFLGTVLVSRIKTVR